MEKEKRAEPVEAKPQMNISEILRRIKPCIEKECRKDASFRVAITISELGDIAKYITHDPLLNPEARSYGTKDDEELVYGQLFVQTLLCATIRGINIEQAIEEGLKNLEERDWAQKKGKLRQIEGLKMLKGIPIFPGLVKGEAVVIKSSKKDLTEDLTEDLKGKILVMEGLIPDVAFLARPSSGILGIVTDQGGSTSHGAKIVQEFKIPCISGTGNATKIIKSGDFIILKGDVGEIVIKSEDGEAK